MESEDAHLSSFPWRINTLIKGGVCNKHCSALLRKHVFPEFTNPHPFTAPDGHEISMGWSYNCLVLDADEDAGLSASVCELRRESDAWIVQ